MKKLLLIILSLGLLFNSNAQIVRAYSMRFIPVTPTILPSGSFNSFSTTVGTASAAQTITFTGINLTANVVFTAGTGMEVSSNGSSYASTATYTQSGGNASGTVYYRIAAATAVGSYSGNLTGTSSPAPAVNIPYSATVNTTSSKDTAKFQMDTTTAFNVAGWGILNGDPSKNIKTASSGHNSTINITTVATDFLHWQPFGSACTGANTGITNSTIPTGATGVMKECYFNAVSSYNSADPQFIVSGLDPTKTYDVVLYAALNASFSLDAHTEYRVAGASVQTVQILNVSGNTSTPISFPAIAPNSSGNINIYFNLSSSNGGVVAVMNAITVSQN